MGEFLAQFLHLLLEFFDLLLGLFSPLLSLSGLLLSLLLDSVLKSQKALLLSSQTQLQRIEALETSVRNDLSKKVIRDSRGRFSRGLVQSHQRGQLGADFLAQDTHGPCAPCADSCSTR
jgi:hypothetical protein